VFGGGCDIHPGGPGYRQYLERHQRNYLAGGFGCRGCQLDWNVPGIDGPVAPLVRSSPAEQVRGEEEQPQMKNLFVRFVREEQGQDLIEYTLLMAFVCLAAAAIFIPTGRTVASIWSITNKSLSQAASAASN